MERFESLIDIDIFRKISTASGKHSLELWLIGGYVRDLFLKRNSKDIDIVVKGNGIETARILARELKADHLAVYKNFGTAQLRIGEYEIEIVGARKESYRANSRKPIVENGSLEDDQNRRDFTINAMALSLMPDNFGELTDPFNGLADLDAKIIRTPLEPKQTFSDDPLRMMRAVRFASQLDFKIDDVTMQGLTETADRIEIISAERIADELNKVMQSNFPTKGFLILNRVGLLKHILPELDALVGVQVQNNRAHKDNFRHSIQVLKNLSEVSDNLWLRWAALLHDIGKAPTRKYVEGIGWTFYGHELRGERMLKKLFKRMKLPMDERMKYVQKIVKLHMRPIALVEDSVTDSAIRRLLFDAGDDIDDLMNLCEADITSKNQERKEKYLKNFKLVRQKLKEIEEKDQVRNFQPPVDGQEIMDTFNLPPSREVGFIKDAIKDAILDGVIPNDYQAAKAFMFEKAKELGIGKN